MEHPEPGEIVFVDEAGNAHARRWTNRQSGLSAARETTSSILVVAEAMHENATADVAKLMAALADELNAVWGVRAEHTVLGADAPRFEF